MSEPRTLHVWITKYALTQGVLEFDAELVGSGRILVRGRDGSFDSYYHRPDWYESKEFADARVQKMVKAKIANLRKQLARLEAMDKEHTGKNA